MFALDDADVVDDLVEVSNRKLRSFAVRPNDQAATKVKQCHIGKYIKPRIFEVARRYVLVEAIEAHTEFIRNVRGESVVLAEIEQRENVGIGCEKCSEL